MDMSEMNKDLLTAIKLYEETKDLTTFKFVLQMLRDKHNFTDELMSSIIQSALVHVI
jgi:hypothetical protein